MNEYEELDSLFTPEELERVQLKDRLAIAQSDPISHYVKNAHDLLDETGIGAGEIDVRVAYLIGKYLALTEMAGHMQEELLRLKKLPYLVPADLVERG